MDKQTFNQEHISLLEEKHQNTIKNIQELQEMEKYMYQNLAKLTNEGGSSSQEDEIVDRISELKQMRVNLFSQLKDNYTKSAEELNDDRRSLRDQIVAVNLVEEELERTKKNYSALVNNKNNRMRMVEIGTYQAQRYRAHIDVLKIMSITALVVIIISALYHRDFVPGNIASGLIIVALAVGGILVIRKVSDLMSRSNFVYDQYNWHTNHAELKGGYDTVYEHDKRFFEKVGESIDSSVGQGTTDIKNASDKISVTLTEKVNEKVNVKPAESTSTEGFSLYF
jgi:hypothetical protein